MRILAAVLAILLAASAIAPGFASSQDSELILRVAMQDDIKGLNPITVSDVWSWKVLSYIFDGPINVDPETDEIIPYIAIGSANVSGKADSWSDCTIGNFGYSPQSTWANSSLQEAIIFYDFENVKWHDDVQMSVRDIMFSMNMAAQIPEWSSSMNPLKMNGGSTGSNFSTTGWLACSKVWESADKLQAALRFQLQEPYAAFFRSTISVFLLPEHIWNSVEAGQTYGAKIWCDDGYLTNPWLAGPARAYDNPQCIGSGPFKFESWEPGQMIKINTWRDHFFREDFKYIDYVGTDEYGRSYAKQPEIDAVTYQIFKTAEAAVLALKSNNIDYIAWSVPPTFVQELANEPGVSIVQKPEPGFTYLAYNMRRESFGYNETGIDVGKPLRQAIAHCIDKQRIVQRLLLNLGIAGTGPISPISPWYNSSVPTYDFNTTKAKQILADAEYKVFDGYSYLTGDEAIAAAGNGNWWVNPDGSPIGSGEDGLIEILTKEANYDACSASEGLMIAQQLRDIGIYAESVAMDIGSIVDIIDIKDFDMFSLSWSIGSDPTDALYNFYYPPDYYLDYYDYNYPGYCNLTYNDLIDIARRTSSEEVRKNILFEAQAAICYDLPIDVLFYKTTIEAYRSDRFTGWVVGDKGSIFCWESLYNIHAPGLWKVNAQFVSPPSAMSSNSTTQITVFVKDQNGEPLEGAKVYLNASKGTLSADYGITSATGKLAVTYTAPWADPNDPEFVMNGTQDIIQIVEATYVSENSTLYEPAPSRITLIKVFPENARFLSVMLAADPDVITLGTAGTETSGFTYVDVSVTDQDGVPVEGASVALTASPAVPVIEPSDQTTDADGKARFKVTVLKSTNYDETVMEYVLKAIAIDPDDITIQGENQCNLWIVDAPYDPSEHQTSFTPTELAITIAAIFITAAALGYIIKRRKKP